ncbi:hypothetical protein [Bifidobacterium longum]|uniref:hypothetical protein n=1 Tax=Bifidobacterium longum TaxID=216816 RepID=UPI003CFDF7E2
MTTSTTLQTTRWGKVAIGSFCAILLTVGLSACGNAAGTSAPQQSGTSSKVSDDNAAHHHQAASAEKTEQSDGQLKDTTAGESGDSTGTTGQSTDQSTAGNPADSGSGAGAGAKTAGGSGCCHDE